MATPTPKRSRVYLEEVWLPYLGQFPPVLDVGKASITAHYPRLFGTDQYVSVDVEPRKAPDLVADVTTPEFVDQARARHPTYGSILFNGLIGYGIDSLAAVEVSLRHFHLLLRTGGHLLIGWNEWDIDRHALGEVLRRQGFENLPIQGMEVFAPEETPGFEHLQHHYTHWRKR